MTIVPAAGFALARVRTLDGIGHPLSGVTINEEGPAGQAGYVSSEPSGFASLGQGAGSHLWRFSAPGHLQVCRVADLVMGEVAVLPSPWLAKLNEEQTDLSVTQSSTVSTPDGGIRIDYPAGTFSRAGQGGINQLNGQSLPFPLPLGWSPLQALHLAFDPEPVEAGAATVILGEALATGETAILARYGEVNCQWLTVAATTGSGSAELPISVDGVGSFTILVADVGATAPPEAVVGQALEGYTTAFSLQGVTAIGRVEPEQVAASNMPEEVTAQATVTFIGISALPSGTWFETEISESYDLASGEFLATPSYDQTIYAYQRPGSDSDPLTLLAPFPLRPQLIFGPQDLNTAVVEVEVMNREDFMGGVFDETGGQFSSEGVVIIAPPNAAAGVMAGELRSLDPEDFAGFLDGLNPVKAFELNIQGLDAGTLLEFELNETVPPDAHFVLGLFVTDGSQSGIAPVLRFASDVAGELQDAEPVSPPRLPGITGPGQYVLVQVDSPQALVHGVTFDLGGTPRPDQVVRVSGVPWLVFSDATGAYATLAALGQSQVLASDPVSGDGGAEAVDVINGLEAIALDLTIGPIGPSVAEVDPADSATGVPIVTAAEVTFTEAIAAASFGPAGLILQKKEDASLVCASLSLNLAGTRASLFPTNPLEFETAYEVTVSSAITDATGLPLEGPNVFGFTTRERTERGPGAELAIYEPGALNVPQEVLDQLAGYVPGADPGIVVCHGSAGTSDPEVPVILVNESTGETATVLSNPDGSFANFIAAGEEDFISATFVNINGTRIRVPATKQFFDNGFVGLYRHGGILDAQSDGGPVQVFVEPEAIDNRTKFKLNIFSLTELLDLLSGLEPEGEGKVLQGFKLDIEGDPLKVPVDVSFPVTEAELDLPEDVAPEEAAYAMTRIKMVNGVRTFEVVDKMEYVDGELTTASPPFPGLGAPDPMLILKFLNGTKTVVSGRVVSTNGDLNPATGEHRSVADATVFIVPDFQEFSLVGELTTGALVATSDDDGSFAILTDADNLEGTGFSLVGTSPLFPGQFGFGGAVTSVNQDSINSTAVGNVYFDRTKSFSFAGTDTRAPRINTTVSPLYPGTGTPITLTVSALDDTTISSITASVSAVDPLDDPPDGAPAPSLNDVAIMAAGTISGGSEPAKAEDFEITANVAMKATIKINATDGAGNGSELEKVIIIGAGAPPPVNLTPDPNDETPPFVLNSFPIDGDDEFDRFRPIVIEFSEPIDDSFLGFSLTTGTGNPVSVSPDAGDPFVQISASKTTLTFLYPELKGDQEYYLTVASASARDINGNNLDQNDETNVLDDFNISFTTREDFTQDLPIGSGGGVVQFGNVLYAVDRMPGGEENGAVHIFRVEDDFTVTELPSIDTPAFPRAILAIPNYSYATDQGGSSVQEDRNLIAVAGGRVGVGLDGAGLGGQWFELYDVTSSFSPVRIAKTTLTSSPISVVVKMDWSAPILAFLEFSGGISSVSYVDLQLLIVGTDPALDVSALPALDQEGVDLNGDGDYVDAGEKIPLPNANVTRQGIINAGLVAGFNLQETGHQILDFDIHFGGRFLSVVADIRSDDITAAEEPMYKTLLNAGSGVSGGIYGFGNRRPKRVLNLFGVSLMETAGTTRLANLGLVSNDEFLTVLDVTDVENPERIAEFEFDSGELVQSAVQTPDGRVGVATNRNVYYYDVTKFALGDDFVSGDPHPALAGTIAGVGGGAYSFVTTGSGFVVTNHGGRNVIVADRAIEPNFEVMSLSGEDTVNVDPDAPPPGPFSAGGNKRFPQDGLLELVVSPPLPIVGGEKKTFTATLQPPDKTPMQGFPVWTFNGQTRTGRQVKFEMPGYTGPTSLSPLWVEADVQPSEFMLTCEGEGVLIKIYPKDKKEITVAFDTYVKAIDAFGKTTKELIDLAAVGPVTGEVSYTIGGLNEDLGGGNLQFALANEFKECAAPPNFNRVFLTWEAAIKFDPLVAVSGKVKLGFNFSALGEATIFLEGYGKVSLELLLIKDECGNAKACSALKGAIGIKTGFELDLASLFGVTLAADTQIEAVGQICTDFTTKVVAEFDAEWKGVKGILTQQALGGILQQQSVVTIVNGQDFIDPPISADIVEL